MGDPLQLFLRGSYDTAAGLAVVALEEIGKAFLMSAMFWTRKEDRPVWKSFWCGFRSHWVKRICAGFVAHGYPDVRLLEGQALLTNLGQLDLIRRVAFYTDRIDGRWIRGGLTATDAQQIINNVSDTVQRFAEYTTSGAFDSVDKTDAKERFSKEPFVKDLVFRLGRAAKWEHDELPPREEFNRILAGRTIRRLLFFR